MKEDFSFIDFKKLLEQGNQAEEIVINTLKPLNLNKVNHQNYPFDLIDKNGKTYEIKSHMNTKKYKTFPAETHQNRNKIESTPEYITNPPDYIIQLDMIAEQMFIFNGKTFCEYVKQNMKKALPFKNASSLGILIEWNSKEAGFLKCIDFTANNNN